MSEYKKGDRVRVSFEAEIKHVFADGDLRFQLVDHYDTDIPHEADFSIEKVEAPVVTFQPGDVVRGLGVRDLYITLAKGGYVNHQFGTFYPYDGAVFTSEHYELVTL